MIRILAIADDHCPYLEQYLRKTPSGSLPVDYLLSCGDLDIHYLDTCASASNRVLFYVNGNHHYVKPTHKKRFGVDLHDQVEITRDAIFCGFAGARWYKPDEYQFHESEMRWITWKMRWRIWKIRLWEKLLGQPPKPVIVLSHAPMAGIHDQEKSEHQGFACFQAFARSVRPRLWLHGHVHLNHFNQIQKTQVLDTWVVNVYQFKYITLHEHAVSVGYVFPKGGP